MELSDNTLGIIDNATPIFNKVRHSMRYLPENSRLSKAMMIADTAQALVSLSRMVYEFWDENIRKDDDEKMLELTEDTLPYRAVHRAMREQTGTDLENKSGSSMGNSNVIRVLQESGYQGVQLRYEDGEGFSEDMVLFGVPLTFVFTPKHTKRPDSNLAGPVSHIESKIHLFFANSKDRAQFMDILEEESKLVNRPAPSVLRASSVGYLNKFKEVAVRDSKSVFLKKGQMEEITKGISSFFDNKHVYEDLGIHHHMGILLYGPPGTGKTSTITAIANEFKMNIVFINLASMMSDDALESVMEDIPERSLIVLEDVDTVSTTRDRSNDSEDEERGKGITLGGLLNVLDGQMSPDGCIFAMTTNHINKLDEALIRPGRVEYRMLLDYMDQYQFDSFFRYVFKKEPVGFPEINTDQKVTPSEIVGVLRKHIYDFAEAEVSLREYLSAKAVEVNV